MGWQWLTNIITQEMHKMSEIYGESKERRLS